MVIGIDPKIIRIIEKLYQDTECSVVMDGNLTKWFHVLIGVIQGCLLSPTLFLHFSGLCDGRIKVNSNSLQWMENHHVTSSMLMT